jgi:dynein heavy chain
MGWGDLMEDTLNSEEGPWFISFLSEPTGDELVGPYQEVTDYDKIKIFLEEKLEDYNNEPKTLPMDLVLFADAMGHLNRIHRVISQPRGNVLLVGVGGSGRQSLARLASYTADMNVFTIELTKQYRGIEFHDDLKKLYMLAGVEGKQTVFLFNDTQAKEESFIEDINNILNSGEVPNLFGKDELPEIFDGLAKPAKAAGIDETADALWTFFIERVRSHLHIILAMSPIGEDFRRRLRMFPGLVNYTTIDWFHLWPAVALQEVATKFLSEVKFEDPKLVTAVAETFAIAHLSVVDASAKMLDQLKRHNYVTPTNYLELVKGYRSLLGEKRHEVEDSRFKLANGLTKLEESQEQVKEMSKILEVKQVTVQQSQKDCEELLGDCV